jgi:hypothetical protein
MGEPYPEDVQLLSSGQDSSLSTACRIPGMREIAERESDHPRRE